MAKIRGKGDGPGGRNEHYDVGKRKNVPRPTIVKEIKKGAHPGAHVVKVNGREYARDNPDSSSRDNVNRGSAKQAKKNPRAAARSAPRVGSSNSSYPSNSRGDKLTTKPPPRKI